VSMSVSIIHKKPISFWLILSFLVFAISFYGIYHVFVYGQETSYGTSREIPLGLMLLGYAFFVGISVGTSVVGSLAHVFKIESFHVLGKKVALVSLASLIGAFYLIFWDLGGPFQLQALRVMEYYFDFNTGSPIWWMVTFYVVELPLLALEVYFLLSKNKNSSFLASLVGFFIGIAAYATLAFVFASNATRPLWHTGAFSVFFLISALASGISIVLIMMLLNKKNYDYKKPVISFSKTLFFLLFLMLFIDVWNAFINTYVVDTELSETMKLFINGTLSFNFYVFEILIGTIVPMILLVLGKFENLFFTSLSGILVVMGMFFSRFDNVIGGQMLSRPSSQMNFIQHSYSVSITEVSLFIGALGIVGIVYFLGDMFFNLEEETNHE